MATVNKIKPAWSLEPNGYYADFIITGGKPFIIDGLEWDKDNAESYGWDLAAQTIEGDYTLKVYVYNADKDYENVDTYPAYLLFVGYDKDNTVIGEMGLLVISDTDKYLDIRTDNEIHNRANYIGTFKIDGFNRLVDFKGNSHSMDKSIRVEDSSSSIIWNPFSKELIKGGVDCSLYWDVTPYDSMSDDDTDDDTDTDTGNGLYVTKPYLKRQFKNFNDYKNPRIQQTITNTVKDMFEGLDFVDNKVQFDTDPINLDFVSNYKVEIEE